MSKLIKEVSYNQRMTVQMWLGVILAVSGIVMLFVGLYCPPLGSIEPSVLAAFGEVATFSAGLIGIDFHYKSKNYQARLEYQDKINQLEYEQDKRNTDDTSNNVAAD